MDQSLILNILLLVAGLFFLLRNLLFLISESRLKDYLQTSPKGIVWVQQYGMEKAIEHAKKTLIPIGCIISIVLIGAGIFNLYRLGYLM